MANCSHHQVRVYTLETVCQYFYPSDKEWGGNFDANDPLYVDEIRCVDCDADLTLAYLDLVGLPLSPLREEEIAQAGLNQ